MKRKKEEATSKQDTMPSTSKEPDKNEKTISKPVFKGLPHIVPVPNTSQNSNVRILHLSPIKTLPNKNVNVIPIQGTPLPKLNLANFQSYHLPMTVHGRALKQSNITVLTPDHNLPQSLILQNPGTIQQPHKIIPNNSANKSPASSTLSNSGQNKSKRAPPIIIKRTSSPRKNKSESPNTSKSIEKAQSDKKKTKLQSKTKRVNASQSSANKKRGIDKTRKKKYGSKKSKDPTDIDDNKKEVLSEENMYVADGFRADVETLLEKCSHVYKLNFEKFSDIWKEISFPLIFQGCLEEDETVEHVLLRCKAAIDTRKIAGLLEEAQQTKTQKKANSESCETPDATGVELLCQRPKAVSSSFKVLGWLGGRQSSAELAELSEEVIHIAKAHMLAKNVSFEENVAGLFLVYALLNHQPFSGFASLRLVPGDTPQVLEVTSEARRQKRHDVLYILASVLIKGPCQYHVLPREVALEVPIRKYYDGTVQVPQPMESTFTRVAPCTQHMKDLMSLESRYQALIERLRNKQDKLRNLCTRPATRLYDLFLEHIPQGRYFDSAADPLPESPAPKPEKERSDVVHSIKQRAMAQTVDGMRHLTGIQDRTLDDSLSSSESEPDIKSRKYNRARSNAKSLQELIFTQEVSSDEIEIIEQSQKEMPSLDALEVIAKKPCTHNEETINNIDKTAINIDDNAKGDTKLNKSKNKSNIDNPKPNKNETNKDKSSSIKAKTKGINDATNNNKIKILSQKKIVVYENSSVLIELEHLDSEKVNTEKQSTVDKQVTSKKSKNVANNDISKDVSQETNEDEDIIEIDGNENKEQNTEKSVSQEKERTVAIDTNKDKSNGNKETSKKSNPRVYTRKRKANQEKVDNIDDVKNIEIELNCSSTSKDAQSNTKGSVHTTSDEETLILPIRKRKSNRINSTNNVGISLQTESLLSPKSKRNNQKHTPSTPKSERRSPRIKNLQSPKTDHSSPQKEVVKRSVKRLKSSFKKLGILEVADISSGESPEKKIAGILDVADVSSVESPKRKKTPRRKSRKLR